MLPCDKYKHINNTLVASRMAEAADDADTSGEQDTNLEDLLDATERALFQVEKRSAQLDPDFYDR